MDWKDVETLQQRDLGPGIIHPNKCQKLALKGVEWAIQPRFPEKGVLIKPVIGEAVTVDFSLPDLENWPKLPEAEAFETLTPKPEAAETCEACGSVLSAKIGVDPEADTELVNAAFALAVALLRHNYDLTDSQLAEMLTMDSKEMPVFIAALMEWLNG